MKGRIPARRNLGRASRSNTRQIDPVGMTTSLVVGPIDPPATTNNIVGTKRIREKVQLVAGNGILTFATLLTCLPLTTPEIRIMKLSVWASATAGSFLQCVMTSGISNSDVATFTDEGTQGAMRPQIHIRPSFNFRNTWYSAASAGGTPVATFGGTATDLLVVDVTLQFRTAVQTCPAYNLYKQLVEWSNDSRPETPRLPKGLGAFPEQSEHL